MTNPNHTDASRSGDLVKRLRDLADYDARAGAPLGNCMLRAADRIEALEAENERLCVVIGDNARFVCKILDEQDVEIERLKAEVEGLRAKLRSIEKGAENGQALFAERQGNRAKPIWYAVNVLQDHLAACKGTARAALGEKQ